MYLAANDIFSNTHVNYGFKCVVQSFLISTIEDLPSNWEPMPKDNSGLEAKVHCVPLQHTSQEFQNVRNKFFATSGGHIHSGNVTQIYRIQNPQLYKSYLAKKESMQKTAGQGSVNELELFHGTNANSVTEINENGFNRSFAGVNGKFFKYPIVSFSCIVFSIYRKLHIICI